MRWHKYIDIIFDYYKQTLQPYQDRGGEFPLAWQGVEVASVQVQATIFGSQPNRLQTYFMESNVDLSRGLDFTRTNMNQLGPIWLRFRHLNYDPFTYTIQVRNTTNAAVRATVRIYLAPRNTEHGEQFEMTQQRKMFFELDKFVENVTPGTNTIRRSSTEASVTVPWEQTFRDLERNMDLPTAEQSVCGCGWPQHMLLPKGTPSGMLFDLVVFLTNAEEDTVPGTTPAQPNPNCREALSFCGRLGQPYPDRKPMGYPFDRNPFTVPDPNNPNGPQIPARNLEEYVNRIPNMSAIQVRIIHDASRVVMRPDGGPTTQMREISGDASANASTMCAPGQGMATATPTAGTQPRPMEMRPQSSQPPVTSTSTSSSTSPVGSPTTTYPQWGRPQRPHTHQPNVPTQWQPRPSSPRGSQGSGWSRPGSPTWGWRG